MDARLRQLLGLALAAVLGCLVSDHAQARADIVFLLAQEGRGDPAYFEMAERYYRQQAGVVMIVSAARSLLQVREYLQYSALRGDEPWGTVVLVAHGSRWTGLAVPIFDDSGNPAPGDWRHVLEKGEFVPLSPGVVDRDTRLVVDSCGLGSRPDLLQDLAVLLGGVQGIQVESSRGLIEFAGSLSDPEQPVTRKERPYRARIRPSRAGSPSLLARRTAERVLPVEFRQALDLPERACRALRPERLLRPGSSMARTLRAYAIGTRDLHFDLSYQEASCVLRGRGVLIVDASPAWGIPGIGAAVP